MRRLVPRLFPAPLVGKERWIAPGATLEVCKIELEDPSARSRQLGFPRRRGKPASRTANSVQPSGKSCWARLTIWAAGFSKNGSDNLHRSIILAKGRKYCGVRLPVREKGPCQY